jgi:hypothetical protein
MNVPRISPSVLNDNELSRSISALTAYMPILGSLQHRYEKTEADEAADELRQDANALTTVLGMLLREWSERIKDEQELAKP